MEQAAVILEDRFLYWNFIILSAAAACGILSFLGLSMRKPEQWAGSAAAVPVAFALSLLFSRAVHWYCRPQGYESFFGAITNFGRGGFALSGVFLGCILGAVLVRLLGISRNLPAMLDRMAVAGALGIAAGRPAALLSAADRGMVLSGNLPFPWASSMINGVSGEEELRLSVFMIQSVIAAVLFLWLLLLYLRKERKKNLKDGEICLLFLLPYAASQAVLDSIRYDSIYFRSNGFVSVVQICSILTVLGILVLYTCRLVSAGGKINAFFGILPLPFLSLAAYMEYYVQRHGSEALYAYSVMSISMGLGVLMIFAIRKLWLLKAGRKQNLYR